MASKLPAHLKLHVEESAQEHREGAALPAQLELTALMDSFTNATGWLARPNGGTPHHPLGEGLHNSESSPTLPLRKRVKLVHASPIDGALDIESFEHVTSEEDAWKLLEQIDHLIQQLHCAEKVIERQETQLATAVGVSIRKDEAEILASRLHESLQRAIEQTGSDAGAIYLLDESTSELKMRSCQGLPIAALSQPARPLRGSLADLEALMGNAVLVENTKLAPEWNCPEDFAAALCLPIGSPTMPHGTMWVWSEHIRDFNANDIEVGKAAADKILVDIERSVLADEVLKTRGLSRELESASLVQSSRLPSSQPLHADYDIGGWTFQGESLGGNFHTWTLNKRQEICAAMGASATHSTAGALVATSLQTVVETCWNAKHTPAQVLRKANDILWEAVDGDWRSALCYVQVHPASGSTQIAMAGDIQAFVIGQRGFRLLTGTQTRLAEQPDTRFHNEQLYLEGGELLVVASADVVGGITRGGFSQEGLLGIIENMQDDQVSDIADHLARMLPMNPEHASLESDRSLMIVRRRF